MEKYVPDEIRRQNSENGLNNMKISNLPDK